MASPRDSILSNQIYEHVMIVLTQIRQVVGEAAEIVTYAGLGIVAEMAVDRSDWEIVGGGGGAGRVKHAAFEQNIPTMDDVQIGPYDAQRRRIG